MSELLDSIINRIEEMLYNVKLDININNNRDKLEKIITNQIKEKIETIINPILYYYNRYYDVQVVIEPKLYISYGNEIGKNYVWTCNPDGYIGITIYKRNKNWEVEYEILHFIIEYKSSSYINQLYKAKKQIALYIYTTLLYILENISTYNKNKELNHKHALIYIIVLGDKINSIQTYIIKNNKIEIRSRAENKVKGSVRTIGQIKNILERLKGDLEMNRKYGKIKIKDFIIESLRKAEIII